MGSLALEEEDERILDLLTDMMQAIQEGRVEKSYHEDNWRSDGTRKMVIHLVARE